VNPQTARYVAAGLGVALIVLVGGVIFVLLTRPSPGPSASALPTTLALASPSASPTFTLFPTLSPELTPSPIASPTLEPPITPAITPAVTPVVTPVITPEITPVITPEVTPVVTPTVPATATPTPIITPAPTPTTPPVPTSPDRELRLSNVGLDARADVGIERKIVFGVDGPSLIRAELSNASARARVCLWQGNQVQARQCDDIRNGVLERATFDTGSSNWTLTLISTSTTAGAVVDLALDFNATAPTADLRDFRFQGTPTPAYNGYTAAVEANGTGDLTVTGDFDFGEQHSWHVVVQVAGQGTVKDESGGPSNSFSVTAEDVTSDVLVSVTNPNTSAEALPVFLRSTLSWP
jgi:hypothetical protein